MTIQSNSKYFNNDALLHNKFTSIINGMELGAFNLANVVYDPLCACQLNSKCHAKLPMSHEFISF